MELKAKFFDELTTSELYEILKSRIQVFVVEQNCIYQDMDGIDYEALHIFFEENGAVAAYLRAYREKDEPGTVHIGRVLTREHGKGLGGRLLKEGIKIIKENFSPSKLYIEAQCHAIGFYEREGFKICSEEFLDAGIPHKSMELYL